jgi:phage terminase large subunit-like protein
LAWSAAKNPDTRWAIVAPTFGDARDTCAEGVSGVVNILRDYGVLENYNRSNGEIILTNKVYQILLVLYKFFNLSGFFK